MNWPLSRAGGGLTKLQPRSHRPRQYGVRALSAEHRDDVVVRATAMTQHDDNIWVEVCTDATVVDDTTSLGGARQTRTAQRWMRQTLHSKD